MAPMAEPSFKSPPLGAPIPAHDLHYTTSGTYRSYGANPAPAWSSHIGPEYKASSPVATQLVVPNELSDGPVTLTCVHCQTHMTTRIKTGPSNLTWALCALCCIFVCWPCCLIPFCCSPLNVTEHYCSNCNALLGKHKGWKKSK